MVYLNHDEINNRGEYMKKWIWIVVALLLVVGGLGYDRFQQIFPELTVRVILDKLEETDYALLLDSDEVELTEQQRELLEIMLNSFAYEIKGSRIEGKRAYVKMDATFIDIKQLILEQRPTIIKNSIENIWNTLDDLLNGRTKELLMKTLLTLLNDETISKPMTTKEIEVPLQKEKFFWVPQITEEWIKSIFEVDQAEALLEELQKE